MQNDELFFWWSIVSTVIGLTFLAWDIWQLSASRKEREIHKSQVKLWQHHANGILHGLMALSASTFSTVEDLRRAVGALIPSEHSLYSSLMEERLFSEKEIKERHMKSEEEFKKIREAATNAPV